ncbi:MAG: hypothetical protein HZB13_04570 [Acidobacteria bacterium]|nr:hypothetical protein [Acidobacteriota bacterium]
MKHPGLFPGGFSANDSGNDRVGMPDKGELTRLFLLALILGGAALRLWLWWVSIGSNDVATWARFGESIAADGLAATYRNIQLYNHPPLMGLYAMQAWRWAGEDLWTFAHLLKLPGLAGEALTLWALWRFAGPQASAAYAWLPAAILVSGFHGNTDCLYTALVLVAIIAFDRQCHFLAGLLLAAALNVKLIPLVLLPLVFIGSPNRRTLLRLTAGLAIGAAPFVVPALSAGAAMYRNMVVYNSNTDNWGLLVALKACVQIPVLSNVGAAMKDAYVGGGRYLVLMAVTFVALRSRFRNSLPMAEQAALGAALFLLLAPGFAVQYVVFAAPLLCLVDVPAALRWGSISGVFIGLVYWHFRVQGTHLASVHTTGFPIQAWVVGLAAWVVLLQFVWRHRPFAAVSR